MFKVLVVEDHEKIGELIHKNLTINQFRVFLATDLIQAKKIFFDNDLDIIVCDILLPDGNGIEFCKFVKYAKPEIPVILLTALGELENKLDGFSAGADDYMVKPFEIKELIVRMNVLLNRYNRLKQNFNQTIRYHDLELNPKNKEVYFNGRPILLTPKEFHLLNYFMMNPERVISKKEIAENVWNIHFDTGTNIVDVYINYLRKKIHTDSRKYIHTRPGLGYILKIDENEG